MKQIKSTNTKPELAVRRLLHGLGYRYRLHRSDLPGKPDLVFSVRRKIIFVHGCFWHGHSDIDCLEGQRKPKSNQAYWLPKLRRNAERDAANEVELSRLGWSTFTVWECQIEIRDQLAQRLTRFLETAAPQ